MSGFNKSKFVSLSNSIEEELTCGICLKILNNPMTTPCCRRSYCRQCIIHSLQVSPKPNTCPNDHKKVLSKDLIEASKEFVAILYKQEVFCDFKLYGCPQTLQLGKMGQHLKYCVFDPKFGEKTSNKCCEGLVKAIQTVDKLKTKFKRKELDDLKKTLNECYREVKLMAFSSKLEQMSQNLKNNSLNLSNICDQGDVFSDSTDQTEDETNELIGRSFKRESSEDGIHSGDGSVEEVDCEHTYNCPYLPMSLPQDLNFDYTTDSD